MRHRLPILMPWLTLASAVLGCRSSNTDHVQSPTTQPATSISAAQPSVTPTTPPDPAPERAILTDVVQLTQGFDRAGEAYFSPDAKTIIFQASPRGEPHYQMYLAPLRWDGDRLLGAGEPVRISPKNSRNTCGYFSPDGRSILFASTAGKEDPSEPSSGYQRQGQKYRWDFPAGMEIYRTDDWKEMIYRNEPGGGASVDLAKHALTDNHVYDAEGSFSPDGKWICFTSMRTGDGDIYVMRADGSDPVRITTAPGYDGGPFFSPDGKRLLYRSDRQHNDLLQVFVADLAFDDNGAITGMKAEHQLTNDGFVNWGPSWYPDGNHIIYATSRHGHTNYELYIMRDDGTHTTRVTYCDGADILPFFSPDGRYLMWTSKRTSDHTTQIFAAKFHPPADW